MYIIDDTEASLIIDDFTKLQSIQITKVAGNVKKEFGVTMEKTQDCKNMMERLLLIFRNRAAKQKNFYYKKK